MLSYFRACYNLFFIFDNYLRFPFWNFDHVSFFLVSISMFCNLFLPCKVVFLHGKHMTASLLAVVQAGTCRFTEFWQSTFFPCYVWRFCTKHLGDWKQLCNITKNYKKLGGKETQRNSFVTHTRFLPICVFNSENTTVFLVPSLTSAWKHNRVPCCSRKHMLFWFFPHFHGETHFGHIRVFHLHCLLG